MRILAAKRRAGSPRFTPRQLIRLAPAADGALDLCFEPLRQVPLQDLILVAVVVPVIERKPVLSLVLILRGQPRPFRVAARDVDFEAFQSEEDALEASLRVLLGHLGNRHSDLLISAETAAFLRGTPAPEVQEVELANLATSWLAALDPSLAEEHPLLPETVTTKGPTPDPQTQTPLPPQQATTNSANTLQSNPANTPTLKPLDPASPPPLLPPFGPSLIYGTDRLDTVTRGLKETLPKLAVSGRRRALLLLSAVGVVTPGVLYLVAIGSLGYAALHYANRGTRLFEVSEQGESLWSLSDLGFIMPLAICLLFLLALLEPMLVRRPRPGPRPLERAQNPVLFGFVERLARMVGAAPPKIIEVTTDADLGLHRQPRRQGGQLVLTLGLPLLAGLTLEQLAGLLAGETTAWIRRPENTLVHFVRWVADRFDQLLANCTDLQEKRKKGVGQLVGRAGLTPLVDILLSLLFGLTRTLISALAHLATILRRVVEGELASDAASLQQRLVGRTVTAATASWAADLRDAQRHVVLDFDASSLDASPPPDHLPAQVVLLALEERTAHREEHPAPPETEASSPGLETEAQPKFRSTLPAAVLLDDFEHHARRLTSDFYRSLERPRFELEPFADFLARRDHFSHEMQAAQRFFGGTLLKRRPLPVAAALPADQRPLGQQIASLAAARHQLTAALPSYRQLLTQFDRAAGYREAAREALLLISSGLSFEPHHYGLEEWTLKAAQGMERSAIDHLRQCQALLKDHEMRAGRCLLSALSLLSNPQQAAHLGAADWAPQATLLLSAMASVNRVFPHLLQLSNDTNRLLALEEHSRDRRGVERQQLDELLSREKARLEGPLTALRQALLEEKNLFHHHGFDLTLAVRGIPADLERASKDVVQRVHSHYRRCLSRLAWMAEHLEQKAGLPALGEVEPLAESRPWKF